MTTTILTDAAKESVDEAIAAALGDAYDCTRVWDAWSYGTMGPDDFSLVAEDSDRLREITEAAIQAVLQSPEIQALKKDAARYRWLREQPNDTEAPRIDVVYWVPSYDVNEGEGMRSEALDAAIDAAMEKQP